MNCRYGKAVAAASGVAVAITTNATCFEGNWLYLFNLLSIVLALVPLPLLAVVFFLHDTVEIGIWLNKPKIESNRIECRISRYHITWLKSTRVFQLFFGLVENVWICERCTYMCMLDVSYKDAEANIMGLLEYICGKKRNIGNRTRKRRRKNNNNNYRVLAYFLQKEESEIG